jgi:hypothetical protein
LFVDPYSLAVGVGSKDPKTIPSVRRAGVSSAHNSPATIKPQRGQLTNDGSEIFAQVRGILDPDLGGLALAHDSEHFKPQAGLWPVDAFVSAASREIGAWESPRHHVNRSAPRVSVEGSNVVPYWKRSKASVVLSLQQYATGVRIEFNSRHGSMAEELAAQYSSTSTREKLQDTPTPAHFRSLLTAV